MRPIEESTYNAIKAKNLIGDKAPNQKVSIEGLTVKYSDVRALSSGMTKQNTQCLDSTRRIDGKVLVAYYNPTNRGIYLKVLNSEEDLTTYNVASGGDLFFTLTSGDNSNGFQPFSMLTLANGKIQLFINDTGSMEPSIPYTFKCYESANGLGTDFSLKSTICSYSRTSVLSSYIDKNLTSKPTQHRDGRIIILAGTDPYANSGYDMVRFRVCISSDGGATWVIKAVSFLDASLYYDGFGAAFAVGGFIGVTLYSYYSMRKTYIIYSIDNGETFTEIGSNFNTAFEGLPIQHIGYPEYREVIEFAYGLDDRLYMLMGTTDGKASLYILNEGISITYTNLNNFANWTLFYSGVLRNVDCNGTFQISKSGNIIYSFIGFWPQETTMASITSVVFRDEIPTYFQAASLTINKNKGSANTASIRVDNRGGAVNPRNPESPLYGKLNLNTKVSIAQGYGEDVATSFTGIIDSIKISTMPEMADIGLRDFLKKALDQMVTKDGSNTVVYTKQPIEAIVQDLCVLAGIDVGVIETTGISIEKTFAYQSYGDAFQFLSDLASFEFLADEDGLFHFRRDYQPNNMFVAWSFQQGVDIQNLSYELNDQDLYAKVKVYGRDGDTVLVYEAPFLDASEFNIFPQKVLKVDATEASTVDELKKIAQRAIATMRSRTRIIEFSTIAIPHLQIGDFIQLFESSTMSADVYRISGITINWSDQGFMMTCKAFYYGDSVVPIELPTETATQTGNPTLNLIPEMTSNTTPSGVCRASSVYVLYQNDYKPWNAFNSSSADLFWDASVNHGWIEYEFPENIIVDKYMVKARQLLEYNDAMPKAWTFEAFDGEKWIVLDTRTAQTAWQIHEMREYTFTNTTAYPKYRLNITANNGYARLQLEQLAMYYRGGL